MSIEIDPHRGRGTCSYYDRARGLCAQYRAMRYDPIKACFNCPQWTDMDALYEDLTGHIIEPTYAWWHDEYVHSDNRYAASYALDRMKGYATAHTGEELVTPTPVAAPEKPHRLPYWWVAVVLMLGAAAIVYAAAIHLLIVTWP